MNYESQRMSLVSKVQTQSLILGKPDSDPFIYSSWVGAPPPPPEK